MRLRLFFRGEKEYRPKRPRPHRVDTDGDTESEPEEKKIERRKKKFRLDIHDDQVGALFRNFSMFRPLSIHRTQSTCGNLKQLIPTHGSEVGLIFADFFRNSDKVLQLLSLVSLAVSIPCGPRNFEVVCTTSPGAVSALLVSSSF